MLPTLTFLKTPIGNVGIICTETHLLKIDLYNTTRKTARQTKNPLTKIIIQQLENYFDDPLFKFDLPLLLEGTPYQKKVWQSLRKIPSGQTKSYGQLADKLDSGPRAIGGACRTNPIPLIIPCHRVTAKNHLGGYSGKTYGKFTDIKRWLLNHEQEPRA